MSLPQTSLEPTETNVRFDHNKPLASKKAPSTDTEEEIFASDNAACVFRHSGWAGTRRKVYESLRRTGQAPSRVLNFTSCGYGAYVLRSPTAPYRYKVAGSCCHDRFCQPCANDRSYRIASNVVDRLKGKRVRFLTLTVKNVHGSLAEGIRDLADAFRRLRRTRFWTLNVTGGVAFLEVKYNDQADRWHPHFHCLIEGKYLPQKVLSDLWLKMTGDSHVVDIRLVKDDRSVSRYVTKYASKPLNSSFSRDSRHLDEAVRALYGVRLATTFGTWRGVALIADLDPEGWTPIGNLDNWLRRAWQGEREAVGVATALGSRALAALKYFGRPPPPPTDGTVPFFQPKQEKLFETRSVVY